MMSNVDRIANSSNSSCKVFDSWSRSKSSQNQQKIKYITQNDKALVSVPNFPSLNSAASPTAILKQ